MVIFMLKYLRNLILIRKLHKIAKRCGMKVYKRCGNISQHCCQHLDGNILRQWIELCSYRGNSIYKICIFAHEIGHYYETCVKGPEGRLRAYKDRHEINDQSNNVSYSHVGRIYRDELIAWNCGYKLLRDIGFNEWEMFNKYRNYCLSSYRNEFKRTQLEMFGKENNE